MLFESNDNLTLKEVRRRTRIILDALDAAEAVRLLRAIADDVSLKEQARQFVIPLELVAFPLLSREDAVRLLREHLIDFFRFDVPLADRLRVRFVFVGYDLKDEEQVALRGAFERSISRMGSQSIAEWIVLLKEKIQEGKESREMVRSLTTSNQGFAVLDKQAQAVLQAICLTYIDQLIFPLIDDIDEAYMVQGEHVSGFVSRSVPERSSASGDTSFEKLSLLKALGKFEKLGSQQVTNSKIMVKGQNDPVRPTIFNWLRAYRDELGVGAHDAVVRGQFLFHSLNGKGLSADERDQVGMLLKSLDENMPLTIDAGRQEVLFQKQIPNTKYQIPNPPAVRQPTDPTAERPLPTQGTGNISRAVFELPVMNHGMGNNPNSGRTAPEAERPLPMQKNGTTASANRPSAFEQAKAIQQANRESRLSISNLASETVELGKMDASAKGGQASGTGERSISHPVAPASQSVAPAPRAVSFEPAKIDNFSFGAGDKGEEISNIKYQIPNVQRPLPTRTEDFRPNFAPRDDMNVSSLSFSTNHVMPAEKERIREQEIPNTIRQLTDQIPNAERPLPIPTAGASIKNETIAQSAPVKQAPTPPPVNRFRITPTGHRDTVASDDTPSPHVVDLRG